MVLKGLSLFDECISGQSMLLVVLSKKRLCLEDFHLFSLLPSQSPLLLWQTHVGMRSPGTRGDGARAAKRCHSEHPLLSRRTPFTNHSPTLRQDSSASAPSPSLLLHNSSRTESLNYEPSKIQTFDMNKPVMRPVHASEVFEGLGLKGPTLRLSFYFSLTHTHWHSLLSSLSFVNLIPVASFTLPPSSFSFSPPLSLFRFVPLTYSLLPSPQSLSLSISSVNLAHQSALCLSEVGKPC